MATAVAEPNTTSKPKVILRYFLLAWVVICAPIQSHQLTHFLRPGWSDFYPIYRAAQAALHHANPYSAEVTKSIQYWFYGHTLSVTAPKRDREAFVYPGYTAVLFIPLAIIPWPVLSIFLTALWPAMLAFSAWAWLEMCVPGSDAGNSTIALLLMMSSWPAVWVCQAMQPTVPSFALATAACFLLRSRRDVLAGILLAAAAFKPQLVILLIPWLLLWCIGQKRWRFLVSILASMALPLVLSFVFLPHWISQWTQALRIYTGDGKESLFAILFSRYAVGIEIMFLLIIAYLWRGSLKAPASSPLFTSAIAVLLAFQLCIIPGGSMWFGYNEVLLFPGVLLIIFSPPIRSWLKATAVILIELSILSVPVCATIYLFMGYRDAFAFLPFQNTLLPLAVAAALMGLRMRVRLSH